VRVLFSWARGLRDVTLKGAAINVVIGKRMAAKLEADGVRPEKICIISNFADGNLIRPVPRSNNSLAKEWGLEDAFVAGYSGNLGRAHSFGTFLAAIEQLESGQTQAGCGAPNRPVRWLFTGSGVQMDALKREVERRKLKTVLFKPYQPAALLSESLSLADVHLISLLPKFEGLIVPSKYYGIAAAGRPCIFVGDPNGELADIIAQNGTGFVVSEGDGKALADAVLALKRDPGLASSQGSRARALFEARFDFPHTLTAWEDIIGAIDSTNRVTDRQVAAIPNLN
jgi:glycosyltransferase involved in cell wall biosynthesis